MLWPGLLGGPAGRWAEMPRRRRPPIWGHRRWVSNAKTWGEFLSQTPLDFHWKNQGILFRLVAQDPPSPKKTWKNQVFLPLKTQFIGMLLKTCTSGLYSGVTGFPLKKLQFYWCPFKPPLLEVPKGDMEETTLRSPVNRQTEDYTQGRVGSCWF